MTDPAAQLEGALRRLAEKPHEYEPSTEPARRGERRACAVCGNTERATIHAR